MNPIHKLQAQAIQFALQREWKQAIKVNQQILKNNPNEIETILRIGYAYMQMAEYNSAKKFYQKALKIQSSNQIALYQLEKITVLSKKKGAVNKQTSEHLHASQFLKIPGKTIVVSLVNLGQAHILAKLSHGEKTIIKIRRRKVEVRTQNGDYIGALPDDISRRLILFIHAQSKYSVFIQHIHKQSIEVFIREDEKGKKVNRYISFPKDISQDIKFLESEESSLHETADSDYLDETKEAKGEEPIDIEQLAQQLDEEKDTIIHTTVLNEPEDDDFEE